MLCSVSPAATVWTLEAGASVLRGEPIGAPDGTVGVFEAMRVCGGETAAAAAGPR